MRKALVLFALLGVALAACRMMEQPPLDSMTSALCSVEEAPAPTPPEPRAIPDTGEMPTLPPSSHIIVVIYPQGNGYAASGVDTKEGRFTFVFTGGLRSLDAALRQFYATRAPVIVYTAPMVLTPYAGLPSELDGGTGSELDGGTDPLADCKVGPCDHPISDDPGGVKKPGGHDWLLAFVEISWRTAIKLSTVAHPVYIKP
jgi:hypothetical protein